MITGWRRNGFAFACGVLATLTLPPFFFFPLLIPAFGGLYWLIDRALSPRRAFADGWWWGWGFSISGLYWFTIALLTDPEKFAWLIPFALFALTAVIAVYHGVACLLFKITRCRGIAGIFVFSVIWMLVEYARGHLFTGFPWNLAGYSFTCCDALLQLASLVGMYGLTWFAVFLGAVPIVWLDAAISRKKIWAVIGVSYGLLLGGALWGTNELRHETAYVPDVKLRLVQANIQQRQKWEPGYQMQGVKEYVRLTQSPGLENITHVIWPETAVPFALKNDSPLSRLLGAAMPKPALLITGSLRTEGSEKDWKLFNSIVAVDHQGRVAGSYDKNKLVPFGEFIPFRNFIPASWLMPVGAKDFSSGPGAATFHWQGLPPVEPLICYEVIFPEFVKASDTRPEWLLNLTNDAWFGNSSGPYQHMHMARARAVELGVPLVRVSNSGVTIVTDAFGRILSQIGLQEQGVLDTPLPKARADDTVYVRYGDFMLLALTLAGFVLTIGQRQSKNN